MDLNARVDVNFLTSHNCSYGHCDLIPLQIFCTFIPFNIKVLFILRTKVQPHTPSHSGENSNFISFAIFSNGGHLEFSVRLNFTIQRSWSLIMLHVKFEIHGCSGLSKKGHLNGLKC